MNAIFLELSNRAIGLMPDPGYTEATNQAILNLRSPDFFQWYLVPIFVLVFYVYFNEVERKNWNVIMAGSPSGVLSGSSKSSTRSSSMSTGHRLFGRSPA